MMQNKPPDVGEDITADFLAELTRKANRPITGPGVTETPFGLVVSPPQQYGGKPTGLLPAKLIDDLYPCKSSSAQPIVFQDGDMACPDGDTVRIVDGLGISGYLPLGHAPAGSGVWYRPNKTKPGDPDTGGQAVSFGVDGCCQTIPPGTCCNCCTTGTSPSHGYMTLKDFAGCLAGWNGTYLLTGDGCSFAYLSIPEGTEGAGFQIHLDFTCDSDYGWIATATVEGDVPGPCHGGPYNRTNHYAYSQVHPCNAVTWPSSPNNIYPEAIPSNWSFQMEEPCVA